MTDPVDRHEFEVQLLEVQFLQIISRSTAPEAELGPIAIHALARTVAFMVNEATDYHAALGLFREYLGQALLVVI